MIGRIVQRPKGQVAAQITALMQDGQKRMTREIVTALDCSKSTVQIALRNLVDAGALDALGEFGPRGQRAFKLADQSIPREERAAPPTKPKAADRIAALMADGQRRSTFDIVHRTGIPQKTVQESLRQLTKVGPGQKLKCVEKRGVTLCFELGTGESPVKAPTSRNKGRKIDRPRIVSGEPRRYPMVAGADLIAGMRAICSMARPVYDDLSRGAM